MATYYVGPGGSNANDGLSWANRKLTLNGVEDIPVTAGDFVWVGPGTYREQLTCDVSGSVGNPITYAGDVSGAHTDGVGGHVRITGSDDDQTPVRSRCIYGNGIDYRAFRGFALDLPSSECIGIEGGGDNWTVEECTLQGVQNTFNKAINIYQSYTGFVFRRLLVINAGFGINFEEPTVEQDLSGCSVEDCVFVGNYYAIRTVRLGALAINGCFMMGHYVAVRVDNYSTHTANTIKNSILSGNNIALYASGAGGLTENYNSLRANATDRTNVSAGANSDGLLPLLYPPVLSSGYVLTPNVFGSLAPWSPLRRITGDGPPSVDLYGLSRPATASKISRGPIQYAGVQRETSIVNSSPAAMALPDAGRVQFVVPHDGSQLTISVQVYREANYAGSGPELVVRQPGNPGSVSESDLGAAGQWNLLDVTFTPASSPGYVIAELVSHNTATSGSYTVYFDDLAKA